MVLPLLELPEALLLQHFIGMWDVGFGLCGDAVSYTIHHPSCIEYSASFASGARPPLNECE